MKPRSPLAALFLTVFIDLLGFGFTIPLLPFYAQRMHASGVQVTALSAAYSLMQFLCIPLWGELSDRVGRRPVLLGSIAATAVSMAALGLAPDYLSLLLVRMLQGVATANIATAMAYIADVTKPEERARGMGLLGAAFGLGFILGPFLGGVLGSYSHTLPGYAASLLALVNLGLAYRNLPESLSPELREAARARGTGLTHALRRQLTFSTLREGLRTPGLGRVVGVLFLYVTAFCSLETTFGLFLCHRFDFAERETGYFFALIGVGISLVQGVLLGRLVKAFGEVRLAQIGLALVAVGMFVLTRIERPEVLGPAARSMSEAAQRCVSGRHTVLAVLLLAWPVTLGSLFTSMSSAVLNPCLSTLTSRLAPRDRQGGTLGVQQSASSLARVLGPLLAGWSFDRGGPSAPYAAGAVLTALALLLAFGLTAPPAAEPV